MKETEGLVMEEVKRNTMTRLQLLDSLSDMTPGHQSWGLADNDDSMDCVENFVSLDIVGLLVSRRTLLPS